MCLKVVGRGLVGHWTIWVIGPYGTLGNFLAPTSVFLDSATNMLPDRIPIEYPLLLLSVFLAFSLAPHLHCIPLG